MPLCNKLQQFAKAHLVLYLEHGSSKIAHFTSCARQDGNWSIRTSALYGLRHDSGDALLRRISSKKGLSMKLSRNRNTRHRMADGLCTEAGSRDLVVLTNTVCSMKPSRSSCAPITLWPPLLPLNNSLIAFDAPPENTLDMKSYFVFRSLNANMGGICGKL